MALTNAQYDELMRMYQRKQIRRQHEKEKRQQKVYREIPALSEIEDEIATVSVNAAKYALQNGDTSQKENLPKTIAALREKKSSLLRDAGYDADYLEPPFSCPDCSDTGYVGNEPCHCFKQAAIDLVYRQSNLTDILQSENFASFSFDKYPADKTDPSTGRSAYENAKRAYTYCRAYCDNFKEHGGNILLFGETGTGKTFLTHCIADELLKQGVSVIYFTAFSFFEILEQNTFHREETIELDFDNIFSCDLLIIDDLGTEFSNSFTDSQLFQVLNERLLQKKSVIISTNLQIGDLAASYSERTYSRIAGEFKTIMLFGDDLRTQKKIGA